MIEESKEKEILLLCQFFYPEYNSSATLPFDTAAALSRAGFAVDALCGYPAEYTDRKRIPMLETAEGVRIRRVRYAHLKRGSFLGRIINFFSFTVHILFRLREISGYRLVIVYSNPPILPWVGALANRLFGTKLVFVVYDVYPEIAISMRHIRPGGVIDRIMRGVNRSVFSRAERVVALTDEMRAHLLKSREISGNRIVTIPNWAHETGIRTCSEGRARFGYAPDDFVVAYFGNLGVCQETETLLGAIEALRGSGIRFLIAGHGSRLPDVRARTAANPDVRVLDFLTDQDFLLALAASSCCAVTLEPGLKGLCAPSKYYSYLHAGKAVISITEPGSYLADEIVSGQLGFAVGCGETDRLAAAVRQLAADDETCRAMGERARKLYLQKYDQALGTLRYVELCREILRLSDK